MLALKQLFCIFIKYLQATSSFHYTIVHILFNRGIDQKFSASCILLFQQGLDHINCYLLSNGRPTPFQRILNQEITCLWRGHVLKNRCQSHGASFLHQAPASESLILQRRFQFLHLQTAVLPPFFSLGILLDGKQIRY